MLIHSPSAVLELWITLPCLLLVAAQPPQFLDWVTAFSTAALAALGFLVIWPVLQARRARETEIIMEIGRRWDSPEMIAARVKVDALAKKGELESRIESLYQSREKEYYELMLEPGYLEDLGVIYYHRGIARNTLFRLMGLQIQDRWMVWQGSLEALGQKRSAQFHFAYFREMAHELSPKNHWYNLRRLHRWHAHLAKKDSGVRKLRQRSSWGIPIEHASDHNNPAS